MHALVRGGADVIELGVPFSDPMADGPVIQRSSERALAKGVSLSHVIGYVAEFRKTDNTTPVVLMGYANPIEAMGTETFADRAASAVLTESSWLTIRPRKRTRWSSCSMHANSTRYSCCRRPRATHA
jgi:hypothetical protein